MSLASTQQKVQYTSNGTQTSLSIPFVFLVPADIQVYYTDTTGAGVLKVLDTDYSLLIITGGGVLLWTGGGGTGAVPAAGVVITIRRTLSLIQSAVYVSNDEFPSGTHEAALDKLTMMVQQLQEQMTRCLKLPDGEVGTPTVVLPKKSSRLSKAIAFDGSGNVIVQ